MAKSYTFSKSGAQRIVAAVRQVERQQPPRKTQRRRHQHTPPTRVYLAKLTTALAVGGSASARIWEGDPGSESASARAVLTVWDWFEVALESGTKVIIEWINGAWYVTAAAC